MTDLFERRLAERLQAHPLPEEIPDLGIRSVRLGERIRRRRIGAAVLAVVLLLIIPAASGLWRLATGTENPPVISPSSPGASGFNRPQNSGSRPRGASAGRRSGSQHRTRSLGVARIRRDRETAERAVRFDHGVRLRARLADSYWRSGPAQCVSRALAERHERA